MIQSPHEVLRSSRERLGLPVEQARDRAEIKRAYRRRLAAHPPDRDPEGFQQLRRAYEILLSPVAPMRGALGRPVPGVPPPRPSPDQTAPAVVPGATAVAILRGVVASLSTATLLPESNLLGSSPPESKS